MSVWRQVILVGAMSTGITACSSSLPGNGAAHGGNPDASPPPREIGCVAPGLSPGPGGVSGLASCAADGTCPAGQVCFRLSAEIALCDVPSRAATGDACAPACDAGKICIAGSGAACLPADDYCLDAPCTSAGDCGAGTVCTPSSWIGGGVSYFSAGPPSPGNGRCMPRSCQSDQDCARGANGRCALVNLTVAQGCHGSPITQLAVTCVYSGAPADAGACSGAWSCGDGADHLCPTADGGVP